MTIVIVATMTLAAVTSNGGGNSNGCRYFFPKAVGTGSAGHELPCQWQLLLILGFGKFAYVAQRCYMAIGNLMVNAGKLQD